MACAQYETVNIAKDAAGQMNNSQITADVSTERECKAVFEVNFHSVQSSLGGMPLPPPHQAPFSSMGALWGTPGRPSALGQQQMQQQQTRFVQTLNFQQPPPTAQSSNIGGFNHWGMQAPNMPPPPPSSSQPPIMQQTSQLWGSGPQQPPAPNGPGSMFPGFGAGGWLQSKPVDGTSSNSVFNPSDLLSYTREQGS